MQNESNAPLPEGSALLSALPAPVARLRISADFEGVPIQWEATVEALGRSGRAYLLVEEAGAGRGRIRIGLPVESIDRATLHKCIIMVRQYRALKRGRHEFGTIAQETKERP